MAGIYIHIPFCKKRCFYCDFFSSTNIEVKDSYIEAVCKELEIRKNYLQNENVETIYFGGGTPSQLNVDDFKKIFQTILPLNPLKGTLLQYNELFCSANSPFRGLGGKEITLEANPDDLTPEYINSIRILPFNRISVGVQSFNDNELIFLNRRHNAETAIKAINHLKERGFDNISIDLMYGLPGQNETDWRETLIQAKALSVQHISAYHLIYEENTPLYYNLQKGLIRPLEEESSVRLFEILMDELAESGFEHYEISNFAKPGYRSKHNASYWNGTHYLGIGASAHSYNGRSRQWNVSSISKYIELVMHPEFSEKQLQNPESFEIIDEKTAYNEFILTRLRTKEGIELSELNFLFGEDRKIHCLRQAQIHLDNHCLELSDDRLSLTKKGIFISDGIMGDLLL